MSETTQTLAAVDQPAFTRLTEPHRAELRVHCYRMVGSFDDAEDLVQETLLRAWRARDSYAGRASLRAWLYGIATNACLDFLERNKQRTLAPEKAGPADECPIEASWLQPYPDHLLGPDTATAAKESIGLAFLVAVQYLPAKQRAVLILCDVLDWSAKETAELLELSVPAVNSALQRARATLRERQPDFGPAWKPDTDPDEQQRSLLERYVSATERGDAAGLAVLLREDVRFSMPPDPGVWIGRDNVVGSWVKGGFGADWFGQFRCLVTSANGQPAVACYVRQPGASHFKPMGMDVLRVEDGLIKEIITFPFAKMAARFGLPAEL